MGLVGRGCPGLGSRRGAERAASAAPADVFRARSRRGRWMAPLAQRASARERQEPSQKSALQRGGDPASSTLSLGLHALAHGAQRRDDALDSSQLAILEMPVEVLELRKIVRVANVFGGEPRLQTAR